MWFATDFELDEVIGVWGTATPIIAISILSWVKIIHNLGNNEGIKLLEDTNYVVSDTFYIILSYNSSSYNKKGQTLTTQFRYVRN